MVDEWQATAANGQEATVTLPGRPAAFAGCDTVEYRTTLPEPRGPGDDIAVAEFRGLYAHAEVAVEGRLDARGPHTNTTYASACRIPFVPDWETELRLTCHAPRDRFGGVHDTDEVADELAVPGLWWEFSVETGSLPYLESVSVRPERDTDGWTLHITTAILTDGPTEECLTYSVRPASRTRGGGRMERRTMEATDAGRTTATHTLSLRDPARWWPAGHGDQHRHVLRVKLGDQERTTTFGLCDVSFDDGLSVNGEPVPVRGVTLLDATVEDIERARDLNATLVRMYAHAPPERVYTACDEAGLLVWQDLPLTGPGEFDTDRGIEVAGAIADRAASHPSVAVFAVQNEPVAVASGLGGGLRDRLRLRWRASRAAYDNGPARTVADVLPDPVFPAVGGPGLGCEAAAYYPGWLYGAPEDITRLLARYPARVVAAYGAPAPGPESTRGETVLRPSEQASLVRRVSECLRREQVGAVAHTLRDAGNDGYGVFDTAGQPKPAQFALARAFEPVQAMLSDPTPGRRTIVVVNDRPAPVSGTLRWTTTESEGTFEVSLDAGGRWSDGPIEVPDSGRVALELSGEWGRVENTYEF